MKPSSLDIGQTPSEQNVVEINPFIPRVEDLPAFSEMVFLNLEDLEDWPDLVPVKSAAHQVQNVPISVNYSLILEVGDSGRSLNWQDGQIPAS